MQHFVFELTGDRREDGSVCIYSEDLPMFSVVGRDEREALNLAMDLLPDYLKANVPQFVELKPARSTRQAISHDERILPAHMIVVAGDGGNAGSTPRTA